MFKNKILLITGGTGSFGNAVLDKFLESQISEIRIFSRDEKKQALAQWLRRVPDNPGGLMRRKFQHETKQRLRRGEYENRQGDKVWEEKYFYY